MFSDKFPFRTVQTTELVRMGPSTDSVRRGPSIESVWWGQSTVLSG